MHNALALEGNRYKIQLARVAVKRALIAAAGIIMERGGLTHGSRKES